MSRFLALLLLLAPLGAWATTAGPGAMYVICNPADTSRFKRGANALDSTDSGEIGFPKIYAPSTTLVEAIETGKISRARGPLSPQRTG